jgi:hypothetical protein
VLLLALAIVPSAFADSAKGVDESGAPASKVASGTRAEAVRALAGLSAFTFTDATLTPGTTTIMAAHLTDLRTALNAARALLPLPAIIYTNPTITAGTSVISAADLNNLRAGVQ